MKRILTILLLVALFLSLPVQASEENITVAINGTKILMESDPFIQDGRTMVPIRTIAEVFGAESIAWDESLQRVTIQYEGYDYKMTIGSPTYLMGGVPREMDTVPVINEGRTMLPLRYVAETFGIEVFWDEATQTVELTKVGVIVPDAYILTNDYTEEDLLWLARIVNVEGLDIGYEAKLAIANVVLNRVEEETYPDTVNEVIMDDAYAVQFPPAHRSSFQTLEPDEQSWLVAQDALNGLNNIDDCLYFNNRPFKWKADDLHSIIEGEYFYR